MLGAGEWDGNAEEARGSRAAAATAARTGTTAAAPGNGERLPCEPGSAERRPRASGVGRNIGRVPMVVWTAAHAGCQLQCDSGTPAADDLAPAGGWLPIRTSTQSIRWDSKDKLTIFIDGQWHAYDVFVAVGTPGVPANINMLEVYPASPVADTGIPD